MSMKNSDPIGNRTRDFPACSAVPQPTAPPRAPIIYTCMLLTPIRQEMHVQTNIKGRSRNHCCRIKAIRITYSDCVYVALVMQHAMCMRCIILSSVVCVVLPYFSMLFQKRHDFREEVMEHKICVLIFSTTLI